VVAMLFNCVSSKNKKEERDKFEGMNDYVYTNANEEATLLEYGDNDKIQSLSKTLYNGYPASDNHGTQYINQSNAGDSRMYKWTREPKNDNVNMDLLSDEEIKQKYLNMYMLSPELSKYDISKTNYSLNCCSAQFTPMFKEGDESSQCDYANKYIANGYSGQNYESKGCACITPEQGEFYTMRGGNTSSA
jgi:hypothetical protein